jgi:hypothetical protein
MTRTTVDPTPKSGTRNSRRSRSTAPGIVPEERQQDNSPRRSPHGSPLAAALSAGRRFRRLQIAIEEMILGPRRVLSERIEDQLLPEFVADCESMDSTFGPLVGFRLASALANQLTQLKGQPHHDWLFELQKDLDRLVDFEREDFDLAAHRERLLSPFRAIDRELLASVMSHVPDHTRRIFRLGELIEMGALPDGPVSDHELIELGALPDGPVSNHDLIELGAFPDGPVSNHDLIELGALPDGPVSDHDLIELGALPDGPVSDHDAEPGPVVATTRRQFGFGSEISSHRSIRPLVLAPVPATPFARPWPTWWTQRVQSSWIDCRLRLDPFTASGTTAVTTSAQSRELIVEALADRAILAMAGVAEGSRVTGGPSAADVRLLSDIENKRVKLDGVWYQTTEIQAALVAVLLAAEDWKTLPGITKEICERLNQDISHLERHRDNLPGPIRAAIEASRQHGHRIRLEYRTAVSAIACALASSITT